MKFSNKRILCISVGLIVLFAELSFAQAMDISSLKAKSSISSSDKQQIEQWVNKQLDNLASIVTKGISEDYPASKRQRAIGGIVKNILNAANGSKAFRAAMLDVMGKRVIGDVDSVDIRVAVREVELLVELADASLIDEYMKLLDAKDAAIKCLALQGIMSLKEKISPAQQSSIVNKVSQIDGGTSQEVLSEQKYILLAGINSKASRAVLVSILQKRAGRYGKGASGTFDADRALVEAISSIAGSFDAETKDKISKSLVVMLKTATELITSKKLLLDDVIGRTEMLIYSIEQTLSDLTNKNKNLPVTSALKQADYKKAENALKLW